MPEPIISVSGLRGVVGESLTPEVAIRFACAFAATLPPGFVVLTSDGRTTGPMFVDGIRSGLCAAGRDVLDAGIAATPTTGVFVREHKAAGGIQISASHNPPEYNGIKLFSAAGRVIPAKEGEAVLAQYRGGSTSWAAWDKIGGVRNCDDSTAEHLALVLETVDVRKIRSLAFRVLLDANHGSGSVLGARLLSELGCETTIVGEEPNGRFAHPPEPTAENLQGVQSRIVQAGCQIGFCQDPDADRLAIVDERGRYVGEEYTLAICVDHVLRRSPGPIVTNCSSSRMSQDLAAKYGVPFFTSKVGEANVVDEMLARGAVLGGEGNGGAIDPRVGLVRDSFVGMALVLDAMAARDLPVSALVEELPRYEIVKSKFPLAADKLPSLLDRLAKHFAGAKLDRRDGLRIDLPDAWLLVRGSNTEPIVRAIAEAPTAQAAQALCDQAAKLM